MKKLLLIGLSIVAFSGVASAETNVCVRPYASIKGTYSRLKMDTKISKNDERYTAAKRDWVWGGSVAAGLKMCAFRVELEYNLSGTARDTRDWAYYTTRGDQSYHSYMLNGYFDIPTYTPFHPYIGGGIGMARVKSRLAFLEGGTGVTKRKENNFAWQVGGGIAYNLTCNWALDIGYRYVDNGHSKWNTATGDLKFDSTEHQITAGVRYTF